MMQRATGRQLETFLAMASDAIRSADGLAASRVLEDVIGLYGLLTGEPVSPAAMPVDPVAMPEPAAPAPAPKKRGGRPKKKTDAAAPAEDIIALKKRVHERICGPDYNTAQISEASGLGIGTVCDAMEGYCLADAVWKKLAAGIEKLDRERAAAAVKEAV